MGYRTCAVLLVLCMTGCAGIGTGRKKVYEAGYQKHVKEEMQRAVTAFQGGKFPYYHWAAPIVQEVAIPAHVSNGVFIPGHKEMVIIKPGEWIQGPAYPIASKEEEHEHHLHMDMGVADITHLPGGSGAAGNDQPEGKDADPKAGMEAAN